MCHFMLHFCWLVRKTSVTLVQKCWGQVQRLVYPQSFQHNHSKKYLQKCSVAQNRFICLESSKDLVDGEMFFFSHIKIIFSASLHFIPVFTVPVVSWNQWQPNIPDHQMMGHSSFYHSIGLYIQISIYASHAFFISVFYAWTRSNLVTFNKLVFFFFFWGRQNECSSDNTCHHTFWKLCFTWWATTSLL